MYKQIFLAKASLESDLGLVLCSASYRLWELGQFFNISVLICKMQAGIMPTPKGCDEYDNECGELSAAPDIYKPFNKWWL